MKTLSVLGAILILSAACAKEATPPAKAGETGAAHHEKHWGYESGPDTAGPEAWKDLPGDEPCGVGKEQSPIALSLSGDGAAKKADGPPLTIAYKPSRVSILNNGHTEQFTYDPGSTVSEGGATFTLAQFHFHSPSEHTLDGQSFPLEIHLVHLNAEGKPGLVLGVFVKEGAENAPLAAPFRTLPAEKDQKSEPSGATIDATGVLPASHARFAYDGSLTTPPCSEGLRWRVMQQPIEMSTAEIDAIRKLPHLSRTNRPIQPLGGRTVLLVSP